MLVYQSVIFLLSGVYWYLKAPWRKLFWSGKTFFEGWTPQKQQGKGQMGYITMNYKSIDTG